MTIKTTHAALTTLALLALPACQAEGPTNDLELEAELADEEEGEGVPNSAADALEDGRGTPAFPGFGVDVSVVGNDVVLDWSVAGPSGADVRLYRTTEPTDLSDAAALPSSGAEVIVLPAGTTSYIDADAAHHDQPTSDTFYRLSIDGQPSTMLMKKTTEMAPGYNKLGLCMLGGPSRASDVAAQLGSSVTGVFTWNAANQAYQAWFPNQGAGTAADYDLPFGSVVAAQVNGSTPAYQSLVGTVPTTEAFAVTAESGNNWQVFPILYDGPTSVSYWVDVVGYMGMGVWNNLTQSQSWYWGPQHTDFDVEPCQPLYAYQGAGACTSNDDCSADSFCSFDEAAACGTVAAGMCKAQPIGCEFAPAGEVCGCDGVTYGSACEAELAGASVAADGSCVEPTIYDAAADFELGVPHQDQLFPGDGTCSGDFSLVTPDEARARNGELCSLLGTWYIVRLADGGSMGGPGYGCVVIDDDPRVLGQSLCTAGSDQEDDTWRYLYDADGNGNYTELEPGPAYWGNDSWRDPTCTDASFFPWITDPDQLVMVPPSVKGCAGWTTLAWEAPADGEADVAVEIGTGDPGCVGQGVDIELRDDQGNLLWTQYGDFGITYEHDVALSMATGERVYLRVHQGLGANWCDSTFVNMVVSQVEE
ncbi:MAG: Kazal-type serine protease inhibitor [Myxococcota bacterium]